MAATSSEEAIAFIQAMQLTLEGKVGFKWMVDKLRGLSEYIEELAEENHRLRAYLEHAGARDEYDEWAATWTNPATSSRSDNRRGLSRGSVRRHS